MNPESPQIKATSDAPKVNREVVLQAAPAFFEIPVTSSGFSEIESGFVHASKGKKQTERMNLARLGLSVLGMAFGLMGSWFVWFRVDRGFWPYRYTEEKISIGMGGSGATPSVHLPGLLVTVTFYLLLLSLLLMAIGTWQKMPKPKRIRDKA